MFNQAFFNLTKRLLPKGRAFKAPLILDRVYEALNESESEAYSSALAVLDSILPDNDNFTKEDAEDWERRLGLISNPDVPLEDRKLAIERKMNHPGTIKARQHYLYLERELRNAGFDVYVHENRFPATNPIEEQMGVSQMGESEMGGEVENPNSYEVIDPLTIVQSGAEMGLMEMGVGVMGDSTTFTLLVNHIDESKDDNFFDSFPNETERLLSLRSSFYVSSTIFSEPAQVDLVRKEEFRQLILKIKPTQTYGILVINYA